MRHDLAIVCPLFNEADEACDSLEKIIRQVREFGLSAQVIVVDDCSTDGSVASLKKLGDAIQVLSTPANSGSGGMPRNLGLEAADSRYVTFYDMGDELHLENFNEYMKFMDEFGIELTVFKHQDAYPGGRVHDTPISIYQAEVYDTTFRKTPALISNPFAWAKLYRKQWLDEHAIRFGDQYLGEDKVFTWTSYLMAERIVVSPLVAYRHRFYDDGRNRMTKVNRRVLESLVSIDRQVASLFERKGLQNLYHNRLVNRDILGILLSAGGLAKLVENRDLFPVLDGAREFLATKLEDRPQLAAAVDPRLAKRLDSLLSGRFDQYLAQTFRESA